ncbi:unnamed protein product [Thlaspi arvense]|uniref:Uncharacterized protein n=1 Tax=Thlaspi arvense TaxID=13288 RepID=A0AAU9T6C0_THLAR|nr:unnamed protein product [Thlaspi arvense]
MIILAVSTQAVPSPVLWLQCNRKPGGSQEINGTVLRHDEPFSLFTGPSPRPPVECSILDQFTESPRLLLWRGVHQSTIHLLAQILSHRMQALLHDLGGWGHERVSFRAQLPQPPHASNGLGQHRDLVVADIKLEEVHEMADRRWESGEVVEVLTDVEDL